MERNVNSKQKWNNDKSWCEDKNIYIKNIFGILLHVAAKMVKI